MRFSLLLLTTALTTFASATSYANITAATFYTTIPACVQSCTQTALSEDGCDLNDFACHCANPSRIGVHIAPCLQTTNCTTSDFTAFSQAVNSVCTFEASVNSTVTWTNQTGSGPPGGASGGPPSNNSGGYGGYSGGGGYGGSPTGPPVAVYTGAASGLRSAGAGLAVVAAVAMFAL